MNKKIIAVIVIAFFAGTVVSSTPIQKAAAANPELDQILTIVQNIQNNLLPAIQTTDNAIKAKTDNLPSDPASNSHVDTSISNAQSAINSHTDSAVSKATNTINTHTDTAVNTLAKPLSQVHDFLFHNATMACTSTADFIVSGTMLVSSNGSFEIDDYSSAIGLNYDKSTLERTETFTVGDSAGSQIAILTSSGSASFVNGLITLQTAPGATASCK